MGNWRKGLAALLGAAAFVCLTPGFSGTNLSAAEEHSVASRIDAKCVRSRGAFRVPAGKVAQRFRVKELYQGVGCETGGPIEYRRFAIKNTATDKIVYEYSAERDGSVRENPVALSSLILPPGDYLLSVAGGAGAVCIIECELAVIPAIEPRRVQLRSLVDSKCLQQCQRFTIPTGAMGQNFKLEQLEPGVGCETGSRVELKSFAVQNMDSGREVFSWRQAEDKVPSQEPVPLRQLILPPANYRLCVGGGRGAICVLSFELSAQAGPPPPATPPGQAQTGKGKEPAGGAPPSAGKSGKQPDQGSGTGKAEIEKWLAYARDFSQKNRIALDLQKLRADMDGKAGQGVPAQAAFYEHLLARYVDCIVAGAQRRSNCKVSGKVLSVHAEADKQRITYEFETVETCPQKTYRSPSRGQTSFEQLERWVRDSCSSR